MHAPFPMPTGQTPNPNLQFVSIGPSGEGKVFGQAVFPQRMASGRIGIEEGESLHPLPSYRLGFTRRALLCSGHAIAPTTP